MVMELQFRDEFNDLNLLPKEAAKVQRRVRSRLLTIALSDLRRSMRQVLTQPAIKRRLRRSNRYGRIYGYSNPVLAPASSTFSPDNKQWLINGIWFERNAAGNVQPVAVPIADDVTTRFEDTQAKLESDWNRIMAEELPKAIDVVLSR